MLKQIFFALSLLLLASCGPQKEAPNAPTVSRGQIHVTNSRITPAELRALFAPMYIYVFDESYAPFNEGYLPALHTEFINTLSRLGLSNQWRPEFDCDSFATLKMGVAQALYTVQSFHDSQPAQSVAFGEVVYVIEKTKTAHMLNVIVARENDGRLQVRYVDIYSGKIMELSDLEKKSITYVRF